VSPAVGSRGAILLSTASEERAQPYVEALMAAGVPESAIRIVTPGSQVSEAHPSGLLLCGGLDVDPARFGEAVLPDGNVEINAERDQLEWDLLDLARERRLPVWGVCRGIQVLNVYLGGSLWQDLPTQAPSAVDHSQSETPDQLAHAVQVIEPGAPVGERLTRENGEDGQRVNSRHHQAIRRLAEGFVPVALSPDGLVEAAVLDRDGWWVRAVQWHPENLIALDAQRALWIDFVRAAGFDVP
jgi:putative glutamine amidotransferase